MKDIVIVLDPGHGGRDPGAVSNRINEKDLNLKIAARLYILLKSYNIKVKMTRTDDRYLLLSDRVVLANKLKADIFISIHCNAASSTIANGIETLYFPGSVKGENLAEKIQFNLIDKLKRTDRGIKSRNDLFVLRYTTMPAVLIEYGFLSNPEERELLCDDNYRDDLVAAIFCGISEYFKI